QRRIRRDHRRTAQLRHPVRPHAADRRRNAPRAFGQRPLAQDPQCGRRGWPRTGAFRDFGSSALDGTAGALLPRRTGRGECAVPRRYRVAAVGPGERSYRYRHRHRPLDRGRETGKSAAMILVIDNYDSFTFNLVHYVMELGAEVRVARNDEITVAEAMESNAAGFLISPGPCTPNEAGISLGLAAACAAAARPLRG